jgi:hypothetical protein
MLSAEETKREVYYLYNSIRNEDTISCTYVLCIINSIANPYGYAIPMIVLLTLVPCEPCETPVTSVVMPFCRHRRKSRPRA